MVGTQNKGLLVFEKNGQDGIQIPLKELKGREGSYSVTAMTFDRFKQVTWVFIQNTGLCQYDTKNRTLKLINRSVKIADCLKIDSKGNLWIGTNGGGLAYCFNMIKAVIPFQKISCLQRTGSFIFWKTGKPIYGLPLMAVAYG